VKTISFGAIALCFATSVSADPVADRTAAMDQIRVGAATLVPMLKGDAEFDAKIAELALRMTYAGAIAFKGDLFPDGATSKGANPDIWTNFADFTAKREDFVVHAAAAVKTLPSDLEGLKAVYQPLLDDCAACHKPYRIKEN
jgi:cytochrome c556